VNLSFQFCLFFSFHPSLRLRFATSFLSTFFLPISPFGMLIIFAFIPLLFFGKAFSLLRSFLFLFSLFLRAFFSEDFSPFFISNRALIFFPTLFASEYTFFRLRCSLSRVTFLPWGLVCFSDADASFSLSSSSPHCFPVSNRIRFPLPPLIFLLLDYE